jgi:uncharacterized membrane protein
VTGGSGSSTLTIQVGSNVAAGTYIVTVHGTSGSLTHLTAVQVTVTVASTSQTQQSGNNILGLAPTLFYTVTGVIAALIVAGIGVAIRMRKPKLP